MNTPVYREMVRLLNNKMNVSRNTVYNWFVKGSEYLNKVLREFLDKTEIDALQSDGFRSSSARLLPKGRKNVYMYLDKELVDVDHLCCLAHARAKFKYALEQGKDEEAEYFIRNIGRLYDLEEQYRLRHLTPEQIQQERQGEKTSKIITQIRQRLDKLLADGNGMRGDLMQKALNYLRSFWDQLFLYIKDGRYFKEFFKAIMQGRTDYENMLPMTIGIKK